MKALVQRVQRASVEADGVITGEIGIGYLIFLGVGSGDTENDADKLLKKISGLRIFSDANDKINLSVHDVDGGLLIVSQFTLYADCRKGNRPNFTQAAPTDKANQLYEYFVQNARELVGNVSCGVFGADMKVSILNDGPFTVMLDTDYL